MSISQTFHLAHQARGKLSFEASQQDHDLRLLVGHANLLDSLMIHLADAEQSQGHWFDSITGPRTQEAREHEKEEYGSLAADYDSDTDSEVSDDEEDEDEEYEVDAAPRSMPLVQVRELYTPEDYDEDSSSLEDDDDDEDGFYTLTRTVSHRGPPSLCSDLSDSDDDENSPPPSPHQPILHHPAQQKQPQIHSTMATGFYAGEEHDMPPPHHTDENYFDVQYFPRGAAPITSY